jgi:type I restriction enzyme S subunit
MASEWMEMVLKEAIDIKHGFAFPGENIRDVPRGDILLTPGNFAIGGGFKGDKFKYFDGEVPEEYVLNEGDLIVTMTDLSKQSDTLGYPAFVPESLGPRFLHNQRLGKVRIKEGAELDKIFLFYLLRSAEYRNEILASATGTTVKHTSPGRILTFKADIPKLPEQVEIGRVLGRLDDRIELNRRMNEALEAIARAIFKSWFVDFDPVRAKTEGRDTGLPSHIASLFPDSFEDSELGEIPAGWAVKSLGEVTNYLNRGISPSYVDDGGVLVLNQKCIRHGEVDASKGRRHDPLKRSIVDRILQFGDILVNSTGVGTLGRVAQFLQVEEETIVDSHVTVVRAAGAEVSEHYLGVALGLRQDEIEALGEGSTGQTELSRSKLAEILVLVPSPPIIDQFDRLCGPLRQARITNGQESASLASSRDALLPKLISGQLRVRQIKGNG